MFFYFNDKNFRQKLADNEVHKKNFKMGGAV
jgi:hypothetical protein